MANELQPGDTRVGWLVDGDSSTPQRVVGLRNTGDDVQIEIPYESGDPYSYWFAGDATYGDDPDKTKRSYEPPKTLLFHDRDGPVVLVGCAFHRSSIGAYGGRGVLSAGCAIVDAHSLRYDKVNGIRSVLPAIGQWSGISSTTQQQQLDDRGRSKSFQLDLASGEPVPLAHSMNLTLRPSWRTTRGETPGHTIAVDEVHLETSLRRPTNLDEHFSLHRTIQELLVVAAGIGVGFTDVLVNRSDDPQRTLDGTARGERWAPLVTHRIPTHIPASESPRFIFDLADIGPAGVRRWLRLRKNYDRGLRPLIATLDGKASTLESQLFSLGVAIEAIGYQSELEDGGAKLDGRGQLSFPKAMDRILGDIGWNAIRDQEGWQSRMRAAYSGIKHADQPLPDVRTMFETSQLAKVVLRSWVASQLGASQSNVRYGFAMGGAAQLVPAEA